MLILLQILTVQCFGYSCFGLTVLILRIFANMPLSPHLLFHSNSVRTDTVEGWLIGLSLCLMGLQNIVPLVYMVERSRLCIDFSMTFFLVHFVLVWWYQGAFPWTAGWWVCCGVAGALMAIGGREACMRRELLPIALRSLIPPSREEPRDPGPDLDPVGAEEMELEDMQPPAEVVYDDTSSWSGDDWGNEEPVDKTGKTD